MGEIWRYVGVCYPWPRNTPLGRKSEIGVLSPSTMPCLVLRGEISDILTEAIVDRMQAIKPEIQRATIPKRGHAPLLDEPESLHAIDAFLDSLP